MADEFTLANMATLNLKFTKPDGTTFDEAVAFPLYEVADELAAAWDSVAEAKGTKKELWAALRTFIGAKFPTVPVDALTSHGCELLAKKILDMAADAKKGGPG